MTVVVYIVPWGVCSEEFNALFDTTFTRISQLGSRCLIFNFSFISLPTQIVGLSQDTYLWYSTQPPSSLLNSTQTKLQRNPPHQQSVGHIIIKPYFPHFPSPRKFPLHFLVISQPIPFKSSHFKAPVGVV